MLQGEHSAILWTFIKLPFVIKIFVLSIFEWLLKIGFTVHHPEIFIKSLILQCKASIPCSKTRSENFIAGFLWLSIFLGRKQRVISLVTFTDALYQNHFVELILF